MKLRPFDMLLKRRAGRFTKPRGSWLIAQGSGWLVENDFGRLQDTFREIDLGCDSDFWRSCM